jgi:hypothetical protein
MSNFAASVKPSSTYCQPLWRYRTIRCFRSLSIRKTEAGTRVWKEGGQDSDQLRGHSHQNIGQMSNQPRDYNFLRTMDKSRIAVRQHVSQEKMTKSEKAVVNAAQKTTHRRQNTGGSSISEGHVSLDRGRVCSRFEKRTLTGGSKARTEGKGEVNGLKRLTTGNEKLKRTDYKRTV